MGDLSRYVDPTGDLSKVEILDKDLDQIIEEINRNQDQLDALDSAIKIVARDQITTNYDAASHTYPLQIYNYGGGTVGSFLCFMKRSDQPDNLYPVPYYESAVVGATLELRLEAYANSAQSALQFTGRASTSHPSPPASLTFFFYIFRQPTNVT